MSVRISYLLGLCFIGPRTRLILSCLSLQRAVRQIVKLEKDTTKAPADKHSQADQLKLWIRSAWRATMKSNRFSLILNQLGKTITKKESRAADVDEEEPFESCNTHWFQSSPHNQPTQKIPSSGISDNLMREHVQPWQHKCIWNGSNPLTLESSMQLTNNTSFPKSTAEDKLTYGVKQKEWQIDSLRGKEKCRQLYSLYILHFTLVMHAWSLLGNT